MASTVEEAGGAVTLRFDTTLHVKKPVIRYLSWMLKPLFRANHSWCMARGLRNIEQELAQRRGAGRVPNGDRPPVRRPVRPRVWKRVASGRG